MGTVIWWAEERGETEVAKHLVDLDACSGENQGGPSNVWVTLYVGARGKVRSAGFASPTSAIDAGWAECAVERVSAWELSDPRGRIAKVGFRYRAE
jgi:hypothetical protein